MRTCSTYIVAAALLFTSWTVPATARSLGEDRCEGKACLQIGSFNVEYLAGQRRRGDRQLPKRSKRTLKKLAKMITTDLDLEIVALQEINTEGKNWQRFSKRLARKGYRFIEGASSSRNQFVVIAYDADEVNLLEAVGELDLPTEFHREGTECKVSGQRKPVAARFQSGSFDFWLFGLHLKSKGTWGVPKDCPDWVREQQVRNLLAEIEQLSEASGERDVILAGDLNAEFHEISMKPLRDAGFRSQMQTEFRADGSGEFSYRKRYHSVIDHIAFKPSVTRTFVPHSGYIWPVSDEDLDEYLEKISDHTPVWSSFFRQP